MRLGVDEAGKGPVLGPMVAAAVSGPADALPDGVADSKTLASGRREELAASLRTHHDVTVGVAAVEVERIDDPTTDMNSLTVAAQAEALADLAGARGTHDLGRAVVDAGDVNEARFASRVEEAASGLGVAVSVRAEHGADDAHAVVGAASIIAKVERDRRVAALAEEYAHVAAVGSGYPSDPTTRAFLREYVGEFGELPACARSCWQTCADVLEAAAQSSLEEF